MVLLGRLGEAIARSRVVDRGFKVGGVGLATSGFAHFVAPGPFVAISRFVFPEDTDNWVKVNGASEAAIGLALLDSRTRTAGVIGLLVYCAYLGDRAATAITGQLRAGGQVSEPTFAD
ncbi:hypothetical protein [Gordonia sp. CPCC 205333]|uniref:hypothetical protein n=1 Tax=Gordonia sp. CPCC 205333 TaxID=3140790 RepID=UPI003AF3A691